MVQIRYEAGLGHYYEPSENQVDYIARRTEEEILAGGLGLAFSPEYYPGTTPEEILGAMAMAKKYDLATHFHARYSAMTGEHTSIDGVVEILEYARALDAHVHFMHLHSTGGTHVMAEALEMIHTAREEGHAVTFDIYPYDSWATNIGSARFNGDWQGKFGITYGDLQIAGTEDFVTEENFQSLRDAQRIVVAYAMDDKEVIMALRDEGSMIGSDSIVETDPSFNHFRGSGAFSRFIGRYVRDLDIMPLMEGIRKTSYYTARQLEGISEDMALRGRLREETVADITIFDYSSIIDTSSAAVPASLSEGVAYVLVSGQIVKDPETIHTDRKFGQPIANDLRP
jgi:N-acyl-D-aspartate/D-glutamate deacylase